MEQMVNHGTGWVRMEYLVPARGLIGFRTEFLTETRGTGIMHHVFDRWEPWAGELRTRADGRAGRRPRWRRGAVRADEPPGARQRCSSAPASEVYEGMIVGENARAEDLDVNATKEKHLTNIRSSTADVLVRLVPHRQLSLDQALEFLRERRVRRGDPGRRPPAQGRAHAGRPGQGRAPRARLAAARSSGRSAGAPGEQPSPLHGSA